MSGDWTAVQEALLAAVARDFIAAADLPTTTWSPPPLTMDDLNRVMQSCRQANPNPAVDFSFVRRSFTPVYEGPIRYHTTPPLGIRPDIIRGNRITETWIDEIYATPDEHSVRFSEMSEAADAEMEEWDKILRGK